MIAMLPLTKGNRDSYLGLTKKSDKIYLSLSCLFFHLIETKTMKGKNIMFIYLTTIIHVIDSCVNSEPGAETNFK